MRSPARILGAFALAALLAVTIPPARGDALTKKNPSSARRAAAKPAPGWVVDRVRVEPLDARRPLGVDGLGSYRGAIDIVPSGGTLAIVNELSLEDYLLGISEVPPSWPIEAQRAQTIAARTYAAYVIANPSPAMSALGAHLCADDRCQVYAGVAKERRPGAGAWSSAVRSTAGLGLLYRGTPILAKYSSTNGGRTVAGGKPYLRAIDDPDDAVSPYHRWRSEIPLTALAPAFGLPGEAFAAQRIGDLIDVEWSSPDGANAGVAEVPVGDFRARLNQAVPSPPGLPAAVPSTKFDLLTDAAAGVLRLEGRAWGHGIGMSQFGALGKAQRGMRAGDILATYYGGIRPTPMPTAPAVVRVALDESRATAVLAAEGRFRVLDQNRKPIAVVAGGAWRIVPAPRGRVRVLPPPEQAGTPVVTSLLPETATTAPGQRLDMRFRLSAPAAVRVTLRASAGGPETVVASRLLEAGEIVQRLPALARAGGYVVTVRADAGGGRTATLPVALRVVHAAAAKPAPRSAGLVTGGALGGVPRLLAALLLLALLRVAWARRVEVGTAVRVEFEALRDRRGAS